jgi:hypothetical protein
VGGFILIHDNFSFGETFDIGDLVKMSMAEHNLPR